MCDLLGGVTFYSNSYVFNILKVTYLECLVLELLLSNEKITMMGVTERYIKYFVQIQWRKTHNRPITTYTCMSYQRTMDILCLGKKTASEPVITLIYCNVIVKRVFWHQLHVVPKVNDQHIPMADLWIFGHSTCKWYIICDTTCDCWSKCSNDVT